MRWPKRRKPVPFDRLIDTFCLAIEKSLSQCNGCTQPPISHRRLYWAVVALSQDPGYIKVVIDGTCNYAESTLPKFGFPVLQLVDYYVQREGDAVGVRQVRNLTHI